MLLKVTGLIQAVNQISHTGGSSQILPERFREFLTGPTHFQYRKGKNQPVFFKHCVAIIKDGSVRRYSFGIAGLDPIRDYLLN